MSDVHPLSHATALVTQGAQADAKEHCSQCGEGFSSVAALIHHVERTHSGGSFPVSRSAAQGAQHPSGPPGELQRCPECGESFSDAVALVRHVQRHQYTAARAQTARSTECVIS
jgi:uncharacterized C2H2 Zn-finger protein